MKCPYCGTEIKSSFFHQFTMNDLHEYQCGCGNKMKIISKLVFEIIDNNIRQLTMEEVA